MATAKKRKAKPVKKKTVKKKAAAKKKTARKRKKATPAKKKTIRKKKKAAPPKKKIVRRKKKAAPAKKKTAPVVASAKKDDAPTNNNTAAATSAAGVVDKISIRMYRAGTGDCFILQFKSKDTVTFNLMIDCGCIGAGKETFTEIIEDLKAHTGGTIDLLVVTHEHADHINGFNKSSDKFDELTFKKVWFSWTESKTDAFANDLRKNYSKIKMALNAAAMQLNGLVDKKYYETLYANEHNGNLMLEGKKNFIGSINELSNLNINLPAAASGKIPTMEDLLRKWNVIKDDTIVEFLDPGDLKKDIPGTNGIRFFVLGPPKDLKALSKEGKAGESFEKREKPSNKDIALVNALSGDESEGTDITPFDEEYENKSLPIPGDVKDLYAKEEYRKIDNEWLFGSGSLALRFQRSINNTSLALAIQFEGSEKVVLFPADAEYGNWNSWHEPNMKWTIQQGGANKKVNATYLLNNTVFYKVGHHMSENGTAKGKGIDLMIQDDLAAMATLDFKKINTGWLNTMPNDLLGAELISKTKGKLFFAGDRKNILPNIKTARVSIKSNYEDTLNKLNEKFDDEVFIDYDVSG
jgi:hypothetical protein